ncbi:MAG TPA: ice-binding family protein [Polyangiaceae bacterium]|jgi:hypothetical protein|nr:ice-binding family protein [Polyangiaceae bacterium]
MKRSLLPSTRYLIAIPVAALLVVACGGGDSSSSANPNGGTTGANGGAANGGAQNSAGASGKSGLSGAAGSATEDAGSGEAGDTGSYEGPTVGRAQTFAALAYSSITAANISTLSGDIGVSAGAVSNITGFSAPADKKYGTDSLAPNSMRTLLAQQDVTALVGNIDPRACDKDYTNVVGGLTGDITLYPGVTCMNSFSADVLLNGHVTLDARGDSNAFFIIRGNLTMTVADGAQVVLANGAEACGVFWRISKQVTIGKTVKFYGTVIAGTAITMSTGSTLTGRALAQTAGVMLDANTITIPTDGLVGSPGVCTHVQ